MKILCLTVGDGSAGSTKFRIVQYESYLRERGIELDFVRKSDISPSLIDSIASADVLYNQKCLFSLKHARQIARVARSIIFDFDDAIWTRPGKPYGLLTRRRVLKRLHYWLERADFVCPANRLLADYARNHSKNVQVIPMALDLSDWTPLPDSRDPDSICIGWSGAPVNLKYLEMIDGPLSRILDRYPNVKLRVFSGQRPLLSCPFDYVPFEDGAEPAFVQSLDIGLLPSEDNEYQRGKSPIKSIQYLSCGVPVVGRIEGATSEILNHENSIAVEGSSDWETALVRLIEDPDLRVQMGQAGRQHVMRHHDVSAVGQQLLGAIRGVSMSNCARTLKASRSEATTLVQAKSLAPLHRRAA
jgi:glycosyltransferase involved in cell wall biosynthesis